MKKNIRKMPKAIRRRLSRISGPVVAGCSKLYSRQKIDDGLLENLGIRVDDSGLVLPAAIAPLASQGKYSRRNVNEREIRRNDLPYEKVPRDFELPHELEIVMHCQHPEPGRDNYTIAFQVAESLDPADPAFEARLLYNLNLLQENTFACGVEAATTALPEYVGMLEVNQDIFPPGSREQALTRLSCMRGDNPRPGN